MVSKNQVKYIRQLEQKKFRQRERAFVAEGPKVVGDLITAGFEVLQAFAVKEWIEENRLTAVTTTQDVTAEELKRLSFLQHPQQVLSVFRIPADLLPIEKPSLPRLILALDGIQDPGNLGTIIRVADWFGISQLVCSPDTADAWSPKVVQATMGSIARVCIQYTDLKEFFNETQLPICGTVLDGDDIYSSELPDEAIIVMGNEGNGISAAVRQSVDKPLLIPRFQPGAESLNVAIATAITCAEFRRRHHAHVSSMPTW